MIRLVATDLDGTLLSHDKTISKRNLEILRKAQEQGVMLVLASGRNEASLREYAVQLDMYKHGGYLICSNGARVVSLRDSQVIENASIGPEMTLKLFRFAQRHGIELILEGDDGMSVFTPRNLVMVRFLYQRIVGVIPAFRDPDVKNSWLNFFGIFQEYRIKLINDETQLASTYYKIGLAHRKKRLDKVMPQLIREFEESLAISRVSEMWIDIVSQGVSKALGVKQIIEKHEIDVRHTMAIGDSENDLEMIAFAGIGVAMGNAMQCVHDIADATTSTNQQDGVAMIVEKYL